MMRFSIQRFFVGLVCLMQITGATLQAGEKKLYMADADVDDQYFGTAVDVDGVYAVVGARIYNGSKGIAYIFHFSGGNWILTDSLLAGDGVSGDAFGYSVAIDGDYVIVGAKSADPGSKNSAGAAYVFNRNQGGPDNWGQVGNRLVPDDAAAGDEFGYAVDISGTYAIVGAPYKNVGADPDQGGAYIFEWGGSSWTQKDIDHPNDDGGAYQDKYGYSVTISGSMAAVGAPRDGGGDTTPYGTVYTWARGGGGDWVKSQYIDPQIYPSYFGGSIAMDGLYLVIGAQYHTSYTGKAFVYYNTAGTWTLQDDLLPSDGATSDQFGRSVAIDGDFAIVGSDNVEKAYAYLRNGTSWSETKKITPSGGSAGDQFGDDVGITSGHAIVGAENDDEVHVFGSGAAYCYLSGSDLSLPVALSAFSAEPVDDTILLRWTTESETDNVGFILERTEHGVDAFHVIASYMTHHELQGQGSVSHRTTYAFTDVHVMPNIIYAYRLKDVNGRGDVRILDTLETQLSSRAGLETVLEKPFPNPFNPITKISYTLSEDMKVSLTVFDILGVPIRRLIRNRNQNTGTYSVYWNGMDDTGRIVSSGPYTIVLRTSAGIRVQKVLILR